MELSVDRQLMSASVDRQLWELTVTVPPAGGTPNVWDDTFIWDDTEVWNDYE